MLTENEMKKAADFLGCEPEIIMSIRDVEAPRGAYDQNGELTILFEAHVFWRELVKKGISPDKYKVQYSDILSKSWNPKLYGKYSQQWNRLNKAAQINKEAAYRSASYGMFQIMGNHAESLGFKDVFEFVSFMKESEYNQLHCFCLFIKENNLTKHLISKNFAGFALGYNGPGYKENRYDVKLQNAYLKYKKG